MFILEICWTSRARSVREDFDPCLHGILVRRGARLTLLGGGGGVSTSYFLGVQKFQK